MPDLKGRVALVTGASQGIGRACALALAEAGATVAAAARNRENLQCVVEEITRAGGTAQAFPMDVASDEQIKAASKSVMDTFGKVDILVNNAGIARDQLLLRMKRADWDAVLATNLTAAYLIDPAGGGRHDAPALGQDHQHHQRGGADGPGRAGQLRRFQSGTDRLDHGAGARTGVAQCHRECGRARLHRNRDDRRASRRTQTETF